MPGPGVRVRENSTSPQVDDVLEIRGVSKSFGRTRVLESLDLAVSRGEFLVILGESGCGKTTLLRLIGGMEQATEGSIRFRDQVWVDVPGKVSLPPERRRIGMVFQSYALWPHMTVEDNVAFPLKCQGVGRADRQAAVSRVLALVRCGELAGRYPGQLSGGQQQRVAVARALVGGPELLLMDEPLSNLDAHLRSELRRELRRIHAATGFTGILVTHDQAEALQVANRIVVLRNGRVEQVGTPSDIYERPATSYVADFLGMSNRLDAATLPGSAGTHSSERTLYCRPEHVLVSASGPDTFSESHLRIGRGTLADISYCGSYVECVVRLPNVNILARVPRESGASGPVGSDVEVGILWRDVHCYQDGQRIDLR